MGTQERETEREIYIHIWYIYIERDRETNGEGSGKMLRYSWCTIREVSMVCACIRVGARTYVCGAFARNGSGRARLLACLLNED